jgi:hypothetical protein
MLTFPKNSGVLEAPHISSVGVEMLKNFVVNEMARINIIKAGDAHTSGSMKGTTMNWAQSSLVLNKMCDLIPNGVKTEKGFKEVRHQHFLQACFFAMWHIHALIAGVTTILESREPGSSRCQILETLVVHNGMMTPSPLCWHLSGNSVST